MTNNQPNYTSEGGSGNFSPDPSNTSIPLFQIIPYKGMTAAKVAALVSKQVG